MAKSLNEWIEETPGMVDLEKEIATHIDATTRGLKEGTPDAVRCIMISIRQWAEGRP